MSEATNHQMALDLLRCHLGMSQEEALAELGIQGSESLEEQVSKTHLLGDTSQ